MLASIVLTSTLLSLVAAIPQTDTTGPKIQSQVAYGGKTYYYNACYDELKEGLKALNHEVSIASSVTPATCVAACADAGYSIAGLVNGGTCVCDNAISANAPKLKDSDCSTLCTGDANSFCGGTWHLQVYYPRKGSLPKPTSPLSVGEDPQEYSHLGCWTSPHEERALQGHYIGEDTITPASCTSQCFALGFKFAGVHWGRECFCGQTLLESSPVTPNNCAQACAGDSTQLCGSNQHINLYLAQEPPKVVGPEFHVGGLLSAYFTVGCFVDSVTPRVLDKYSFTAQNMTAEKCAAACWSKKYAVAGVENGKECYCGSKLPKNADQVDQSACNIPCAGDKKHTCGGGSRIDVYKSPLLAILH